MDFVLLFVITILLIGSPTVYTSENNQPNNVLKVPFEKVHGQHHKKNVNQEKIELENNHNWAYAGIIYIGNPPQKVRIEFDTGSSDLWLYSSVLCENSPETCKGHNFYNHSDSSTYQSDGRELTITYGTGVVHGIVSQDDVQIGGITVKGQFFLEANSIQVTYNNVKYPEKKDGILGLGFPGLSRVNNVTGQSTPLSNLVDRGLLKQPVFSFYLSKVDPSSESEKGEIVLGGVDPDHYTGDITYTPVPQNAEDWTVKVDRMLLDETEIDKNILAIMDSGSSIIQGPKDIIEPIRKAVFGNNTEKGKQTVPCTLANSESLPVVTFIIEGVKFVLTPEDYIVKEYSEKKCIFGFTESPFDGLIVGNVFMRKFYTIFDLGNLRIGIATAR